LRIPSASNSTRRSAATPPSRPTAPASARSCAASGPSTARSRCASAANASGRASKAPSTARSTRRVTGLYAQLGYADETFAAHAGVRRDDHSRFGGEWSAGADARLQLFDAWSLHASYGEGFKAPSLFQLFSDFGNSALQARRPAAVSTSASAPATASLYGASFDVTLFRRDTRGLIGFVSCFGITGGICSGRPFGTYDNVGRARAQGAEVEGRLRFNDHLAVQAAYSYLDAKDRTPGAATGGNDLARRPKHALTASLDWQPIEPVRLGADLRVVSDSFDDAANLVPLDGYATLAVRGEWDASEHVTLFGRVENLSDEDYQTAAGYATEGRAVHLGARARW
jgi:vitamin B12 transporter